MAETSTGPDEITLSYTIEYAQIAGLTRSLWRGFGPLGFYLTWGFYLNVGLALSIAWLIGSASLDGLGVQGTDNQRFARLILLYGGALALAGVFAALTLYCQIQGWVMRRRQGPERTIDMTLTAEGIRTKTETGGSFQRWSGVTRIDSDRTTTYLHLGDATALLVVHAGLPEDLSIDTVKARLSEWHGAAR